MYKETYEEFDNIDKYNYQNYFTKQDLYDYIMDDVDNWIEKAIDYDIKEGLAQDFISDMIENKKENQLSGSLKMLKILLREAEIEGLSTCDAWENDNDKIKEILKNNEQYKKKLKENLSDYIEELHLFNYYLKDYLTTNKDVILESIDEGIYSQRDEYGSIGMSREDFL